VAVEAGLATAASDYVTFGGDGGEVAYGVIEMQDGRIAIAGITGAPADDGSEMTDSADVSLLTTWLE